MAFLALPLFLTSTGATALTVGGGLAIGGAVAGGVISGVSAIQQGKAAEEQGKFQQKIANRNAELQIQQAERERQAAAEQAIQVERQGKSFKARQRAKFAKSGVELRGSPLSVLIETAQDVEADRLTVLREGAVRASTLRQGAGITRAQGSAAAARGRSAQRASVLSAVGQGLSTAGTVGLASSLNTTGTSNVRIRPGRRVTPTGGGIQGPRIRR